MIAGLVGGNRVILLPRDFDTKVGAGIMAACAEFWRSIDANEPPSPDFARDAEAIKKLYSYAEPGKLYEEKNSGKVDDLLQTYYEAGRAETKAKLIKDTAIAELLTIVGDAERVESEGFKASLGMVGPCDVSYHRKAYRNTRVTPRKSA